MPTAFLGDVFGFAALILVALTAIFMVIRGKLLKLTKKLSLIRSIHVGIATGAGLFIILLVLYYISWPVTTGVIVGYAAFATSIVVWISGSAFLERVKDALFFHGALSIGLISLILIHAASASGNIPIFFSEIMVGTTVVILLANIGQQMLKMK